MKKIVVANWKMNMTQSKAVAFARKFSNPVKKKATVIVAASDIVLPSLASSLREFKLSGQNVSMHESGAYTGEVSALMLKEQKVEYCLVGHSERRVYHRETSKEVNVKAHMVQAQGIIPIICFGETVQERHEKKTKSVVKKQLKESLQGLDVSKVIVAYEPVWAISTFQKGKVKRSATIDDILEMHVYIRKTLFEMFSSKAQNIPLLYGGSINEKNAQEVSNFEVVDGVLVGGASLSVSSFQKIIKAIS